MHIEDVARIFRRNMRRLVEEAAERHHLRRDLPRRRHIDRVAPTAEAETAR